MKTAIISFVLLGAATLSAPALSADFSYKSLEGTWQVTAVAVPDTGIQALVDDDPQYMGAEITFAPDAITWTKGTESRPVDPSIDNCAAEPSIEPWQPDPDFPDDEVIEGGFEVLCGDDSWGTVVPVDEKTVQLYWYDNGVLTLARQ